MTKQEAIKESIAHWERMIAWAEERPKEDKASSNSMFNSLCETWFRIDCSLCEYARECSSCPLREIGKGCPEENSPWRKVRHSKTWGEWVNNAEKMLAVLRRLE